MIQLDNTFRVSLPVDQTWKLLTDLPRVATCLPGAHLDEVVDGEFRGGLSTKIGPINARYSGVASFLELDEVAYRAVIAARGKEDKGSGSATATITATLVPDGDGATQVHVSTGMAISGRAAQFGRSLLAEVSTAMLGEFVRRLEAMIQGGDTVRGTPATSGAAAGPAAASAAVADPEENSLDLATTLILPLLRRSAVPIAVGLVSGLLGFVLGRLGNRRAPRLPRGYALQPLPWDERR